MRGIYCRRGCTVGSAVVSPMVKYARSLSYRTATDGRNRARSRGIGCGGLAGPDDDPPSRMGHRLSARLRTWDDCRDDVDYGSDCGSVCVYAAALCAIESWIGDGFGNAEPELRIIFVLPDWFRRWAFFKSSALE